MNWLAHAFLSRPEIDFRLGNLMADLVKGKDRLAMPAAFLEGVRQHQAIDAFTDAHPIVHRSRARIGTAYRHATGILIDIFYDHFLACGWERYCPEPLESFAASVYADLRDNLAMLPAEVQVFAGRIIADDLLVSYRTVSGIEDSLRRVSQRLLARTGKDLRLQDGVSQLADHFNELEADFREFFPLLQEYVEAKAA
jgi:acyl carrier protein phosphodiesterase